MSTNTTTTTPTPPSHSSTEHKAPRRAPVPLNGVDTPALFATINVVKSQPELARFRFRATSRWISGTHTRTRIEAFDGAGGTHKHLTSVEHDADHPAVLCGADKGPTPVEVVLHALGSCLMAGIANISAARGVRLTEAEAVIEGDIDLRGLLGISDEVRNGYKALRVTFHIKGDAPPEKLREIVDQSRRRSAVYDLLTRGTDVQIAMRIA
jgi:uncharacterized OsmC-like protein